MAIRDIDASDLDIQFYTVPADLDQHQEQTLRVFNELMTEYKVEDSPTAYNKFFADIFEREEHRRRRILQELEPCRTLLRVVYVSAYDIGEPKAAEDIPPIREAMVQIHQDLVRLINHLKLIRDKLGAEIYWTGGQEKAVKARVSKEVFERRFQRPAWVCLKGLAVEFAEFDNNERLLRVEDLKTLEVAKEWTQFLLEKLETTCGARINRMISCKTYYYLLHWRVALIRLAELKSVISTKPKYLVATKNSTENKVANEGSMRQVFLALEKEGLLPKEILGTCEKDTVAARTETKASLTDLETAHPETKSSATDLEINHPETKSSAADLKIAHTETQTISKDDEVAIAALSPSPFAVQTNIKQADSFAVEDETSDGSGWTHCDPSMREEKPRGGRSIMQDNVKKTKKKTRGKQEPARVVEEQPEPEVEEPDRIKWVFTDPTHFATIRQVFPLPRQKQKESDMPWDTLRAAFESPPLNFKLTQSTKTGGVSCKFERSAMDGQQKMSFALHRLHSLKPQLNREMLCTIRGRLRHRFGWQAEDFELVMGEADNQ